MASANTPPNGRTDPFAPTRMITTPTGATAEPLSPPEGGFPAGTSPAHVAAAQQGVDASPTTGQGVEGELIVWEAGYSMKNFLARIIVRVILTIAWAALAVETWGRSRNGNGLEFVAICLGIGLVLMWLFILYRMVQAKIGHHYRLTNRRLFVSTGLMRRRRDQMELLRVKDVYTRQTFGERWFSLGSVVVVPNEHELPTFYLTGVDDPKQVMDLIWNFARTERDNRSTNIQHV